MKQSPIAYLPISERVPDTQYTDLLKKILRCGKDKKPIHASLPENANKGHSYARELTGKSCCLEYDLSNGFPLLTVRDITKLAAGGVGEIAGFLNGARTQEELLKFGCPKQFWENWVTADKCKIWGLEEGDLGDGSYGPALRAFPTPPHDKAHMKDFETGQFLACTFDQVAALNETMKTFPMSRTIMMTNWIPHLALGSVEQGFKRKVVVAPCHGTLFHIHVFPELGEMEVTCVQRSADVSVGLQFNMVQWCTLGIVLAMIHGLKFTKYTHFISSAQIYDIQFPAVEEMLSREARCFPTVTLEPQKDYEFPWDLRKEDFKIGDDYCPHEWMTIPTPI